MINVVYINVVIYSSMHNVFLKWPSSGSQRIEKPTNKQVNQGA